MTRGPKRPGDRIKRFGIGCCGAGRIQHFAHDIDAAQIVHRPWSHSEPEIINGFVDLLHGRAFQQHLIGFADIAHDHHAVADKAKGVANADCHRRLADFFGQIDGSCQNLFGGFFCAYNFQQLHNVGGAEKMQPDHTFRTRGRGGDFIDIQG